MEYIEYLENENQRLTNLCDQYFRVLAHLADREGELRIPQEFFICNTKDLPKLTTYTDEARMEYVIKGGN